MTRNCQNVHGFTESEQAQLLEVLGLDEESLQTGLCQPPSPPLSCAAVMEGSAFFFERAAYDGVPGETLAGTLPPIHSYYVGAVAR